MSDANSIAHQIDGTDGGGNALPWRRVAMLYNANLFGLSRDYAFTEGSNVSPSLLDQVTTLAKVLTRTRLHADGNTYDIWDAVHTILKYVLQVAPDINDDEKNSVNHTSSGDTGDAA